MIVVRTDLNMRKGKMIGQGAHASMEFIRSKFLADEAWKTHEMEWLLSPEHAKIVCKANNEDELLSLHKAAIDAGLCAHIVTDLGLTEFKGVKTRTCLAIGPDDADKINKITGHLELL